MLLEFKQRRNWTESQNA